MKKDRPGYDRKIIAAKEIAQKSGADYLDPSVLFARASRDDIEIYDADMLAQAAIHAQCELAAFDGKTAHITLRPLDGVLLAGRPIHVLSVTDRNMPFLYDSVMGEITASHRDIPLAVHPILMMDAKPRLYSADEAGLVDRRISHIHIHLEYVNPSEIPGLIARIANVLNQVHLSVADWRPMLALLDRSISELHGYESTRTSEKDESLAFLNWLRANNFTFLGMREYVYSGNGDDAQVERASGPGLGILSDPDIRILRQGADAVTTTPEILAFLQGPDYLIVTKANAKSVVHRRTYMDYIGVKRFDDDGAVIGELRIVGMFTSTAYTRPTSEIPLLRLKVKKVNAHFGFDPESHSGKMLLNTLDSYPRDDLFQIDVALLTSFCEQINELAERPRVRVLPRIDRFDRFVSVICYVPKDLYDSDVRERIGVYLKTVFDGRISAYYPAYPEGGVARIHYIIGRSGGKTPRIPQARLEVEIRNITTRWGDRFRLLAGPDGAALITGQAYQESFSPQEAIADLGLMTASHNSDDICFALAPGENDIIRLKIFHAETALALSRRVPLLENFGFNVISETTHEIGVHLAPQPRFQIVLHDMELILKGANIPDLARQAERIQTALTAAWRNEVENDSFNRLVISCALSAQKVNVLRAYARYLRQTGILYSQNYIADILHKHASITLLIFQLYIARFDPDLGDKGMIHRDRQSRDLLKRIETALTKVPSLDEDRILRRFVNAVQSTLRTNYFAGYQNPVGASVLAFKFDPKSLEGLVEPRPYREIFVYGTDVEGVHLRFGAVARGGIRWSDRAQDYRTEVLGLAKAQQVKNAVIVPVGAKGGFYPKRLPEGGSRETVFAEGTRAYSIFITTLLSMTDNIVGEEIIPPANILRHDGDDPYFVVAADKGTATFSDLANSLSQEAGFWLDDAFASGGSAGYDHKKMGITAKGAWEAVKRHFREMEIDIQTTPFTVAGVGDMSGDVFGNGMLLSSEIRLIAAFDHRDIFIDPDPDRAESLLERHRLFALPRSSWRDYDQSKLSQGAMIISRMEKSVTLTPEARTAIGLVNSVATPFEIMTAILKSEVDLLWFGGIGTYIKGPDENDIDVGDRANDMIRISGNEVKARVIGEGANLGLTQKGRIAYALAGGRLNSDAIDNSAGVNSSDVEVNIKIALAPALRDGRTPKDKRNRLLASMTDEVAALVLANNYQQTLAISLIHRKKKTNGDGLGRLMRSLEAARMLNRKIEFLPDDRALAARHASGQSLTRPEISVLLSYAKIALFDQVIVSDLPDEPFFLTELMNYFPKKMQRDYRADIEKHRLRREIITTFLANHVVNRGGPAFVTVMAQDTNFQACDIVKAAILVRTGFGLEAIWAAIDALDTLIPGEIQNDLYTFVQDFYRNATRMVLKTSAADGDLTTAIHAIDAIRRRLKPELPAIFADRPWPDCVPKGLVESLRGLPPLIILPEILSIARISGEKPEKVAPLFLATGAALKISRLENAARHFPAGDTDEAMLVSRAEDDMAKSQRSITAALLRNFGHHRHPVQAWLAVKGDGVLDIVTELDRLAGTQDMSLARMVLAASLLRELEGHVEGPVAPAEPRPANAG